MVRACASYSRLSHGVGTGVPRATSAAHLSLAASRSAVTFRSHGSFFTAAPVSYATLLV